MIPDEKADEWKKNAFSNKVNITDECTSTIVGKFLSTIVSINKIYIINI